MGLTISAQSADAVKEKNVEQMLATPASLAKVAVTAGPRRIIEATTTRLIARELRNMVEIVDKFAVTTTQCRYCRTSPQHGWGDCTSCQCEYDIDHYRRGTYHHAWCPENKFTEKGDLECTQNVVGDVTTHTQAYTSKYNA